MYSARMSLLDGASVLVTGGTGSFGQRFVRVALERYTPRRVVVFSRDEFKQSQMQEALPRSRFPQVRFFIGDVRDRERLSRAFDGTELVIHAAALKQVPALEYNPFEAIKTNVLGAQNVIECAIDRGVQRVVALSTDKAANPINLYGASKLCSDKLFVAGNAYAGGRSTRFSVVRYGNVVGSRGSVVPLFLQRRPAGVLPITDERMTRFWITLQQGVDFVIESLEAMSGGEIFVPRIPSMRIVDLARAIGPECRLERIGMRPGEKLHEVLVAQEEARSTVAFQERFVISPQFEHERGTPELRDGTPCPDGFRYASDDNDRWLSAEELLEMLQDLGASPSASLEDRQGGGGV